MHSVNETSFYCPNCQMYYYYHLGRILWFSSGQLIWQHLISAPSNQLQFSHPIFLQLITTYVRFCLARGVFRQLASMKRVQPINCKHCWFKCVCRRFLTGGRMETISRRSPKTPPPCRLLNGGGLLSCVIRDPVCERTPWDLWRSVGKYTSAGAFLQKKKKKKRRRSTMGWFSSDVPCRAAVRSFGVFFQGWTLDLNGESTQRSLAWPPQ